jgi:hypothetical protein
MVEYERGRRRLTVWPDGTLEARSGQRTKMTCGDSELAELPPAEQGQYCVVDLLVTNLRSYPEWLYFEDQQLLVASGGTFKGYGLGKLLRDTDLQPGKSVTTQLVFDLPRGLRPVQRGT